MWAQTVYIFSIFTWNIQNVFLLELWRCFHYRVWVQQEVFLGDFSSLGVDGDYGETHLQDPTVHDDLHRVRQLYASFIHCLVKGIFTCLYKNITLLRSLQRNSSTFWQPVQRAATFNHNACFDNFLFFQYFFKVLWLLTFTRSQK